MIVPLTPREAEVAALLWDGLTQRQVAAELEISPRTVEAHVERIRAKTGAKTTAAALARTPRRAASRRARRASGPDRTGSPEVDATG